MLLTIDFSCDVPLYQQLRNQIVMGIADGRLRAGEKLPTVRALAEETGINTMTVSKAYALLKQEGYITTDRRKGASVAVPAGCPTPKSETVDALRLAISELRLAGMNKDEVTALLERLCQEAGL